jgi:hypothetical protein
MTLASQKVQQDKKKSSARMALIIGVLVLIWYLLAMLVVLR